jgi:hypothetical protein
MKSREAREQNKLQNKRKPPDINTSGKTEDSSIQIVEYQKGRTAVPQVKKRLSPLPFWVFVRK